MFAGHLAVALGAKRAEPRLPLGSLIAASFGIDLLWPILVLAGAESVRVDPGNTAFTPLAFDSYPWSHSLALVMVWSTIAGLATFLLTKRVRPGVVIGLTVWGHWLLDFLTHRPDLPIWPGGPVVGLGLWNSVAGTLVVEGALFLAGIQIYRRANPPLDATGRWSFWGLITLVTVIWVSGPWSPPPPNATAVAVTAMILWILVPWAIWIERHRGTES